MRSILELLITHLMALTVRLLHGSLRLCRILRGAMTLLVLESTLHVDMGIMMCLQGLVHLRALLARHLLWHVAFPSLRSDSGGLARRLLVLLILLRVLLVGFLIIAVVIIGVLMITSTTEAKHVRDRLDPAP